VEGDYPNLLLAVLQACYTAVEAEDIGSATNGAVEAGADAALGFDDKVYLGYCGSTWVEYFYRYALDPASPQRTVGEAAYAAMWWVDHLWGHYPIDPNDPNGPTYGYGGYESRVFSPTGGAGMKLLDGGAHWGS